MEASDAIRRIEVRGQVKSCRGCGLREIANEPVPFRGPSPTSIAIVGEAPGKIEDAVGEPFRGPSGELLESILLDQRYNLSQLAYLNAVCCFPDRTPTAGEIVACSGNLKRQLEVLDCRYVLALGGVALNALRGGNHRIGEVRGIFWHAQMDGLDNPPWVLATWHPAAVLRNRSLEEQMRGDIAYFGLIAEQEISNDLMLGQFCIKCGNPVVDYHYEIPYCETHKPRGKK